MFHPIKKNQFLNMSQVLLSLLGPPSSIIKVQIVIAESISRNFEFESSHGIFVRVALLYVINSILQVFFRPDSSVDFSLFGHAEAHQATPSEEIRRQYYW